MLRSARSAGWLGNPTTEKACDTYIGFLDLVLRYGQCWHNVASLHFDYAELKANKPAIALAISAKVAELLKLDLVPVNRPQQTLNLAPFRDKFNQDTHKGALAGKGASLKDFKKTLPSQCSPAKLRQRYRFMIRPSVGKTRADDDALFNDGNDNASTAGTVLEPSVTEEELYDLKTSRDVLLEEATRLGMSPGDNQTTLEVRKEVITQWQTVHSEVEASGKAHLGIRAVRKFWADKIQGASNTEHS